MESVTLVPQCVECGERWLPDDRARWQAHLGVDEHLDEPAELFFYCPACSEPEFGEVRD